MMIFIIGTRPELIKVAPLVLELKRRNFKNYIIVNTGQHRELLDKYWAIFGIKADYALDVIVPHQDLSSLTVRAIDKLNQLLYQIKEKHGALSCIISQGDTTTVFASAVVAFYHSVAFAHIEAGLRSFDLGQPFPEEFNRKVASITARYHFSPTALSRQNLIDEKVPSENIYVVGNTGIDALKIITDSPEFKALRFTEEKLNTLLNETGNVVVITCHRRENQNENLKQIIGAIEEIAAQNPNLKFVWPVHANPRVKDVVLKSRLVGMPNVFLTEAVDYVEMVKLLSLSCKVLTDSGGIQEEAPSFRIPVLILREKTERPEAVNGGYSVLVGGDTQRIVDAFYNFNPEFEENFKNPYGDGQSSMRIIDTLLGSGN